MKSILNKKISSVFSTIIILIVIVGGLILFVNIKDDKCDFPITYRIGRIDGGFKMSQSDFLGFIEKAEKIWEDSVGSNLFEFKEDGEVRMNLVFDDRQVNILKVQDILQKSEKTEEDFALIELRYKSLQSTLDNREMVYDNYLIKYDRLEEEYLKQARYYENKLEAYNRDVDIFNNKKKKNNREYERLKEEEVVLDSLLSNLIKEEKSLNEEYDFVEGLRNEINDLISELNILADSSTQLADKINAGYGEINSIYEIQEDIAGIYEIDGEDIKIDIYQFRDDKDLVSVIAHELGHSLGLDHANKIDSLMYPNPEEAATSLSSEDRNKLRVLCPKLIK